MSDNNQEIPTTPAHDSVINKYQISADISNQALKIVLEAVKPGITSLELCNLGDETIAEKTSALFKKQKSLKKGLAWPTCVSVNNTICHYSPMKSYKNEGNITIKNGDMVKVEVGAHIDGFPAFAAHTKVVGASAENPIKGRQADVMHAAYNAAQVTLRMLKPGQVNREITQIIQKTTKSFNCVPIQNMASYNIEKDIVEGQKSILKNPNNEQLAAQQAAQQKLAAQQAAAKAKKLASKKPSEAQLANLKIDGGSESSAPAAAGAAAPEKKQEEPKKEEEVQKPSEETKQPTTDGQEAFLGDKCTIDLNDVWTIDILATTGDGRVNPTTVKTSIYRVDPAVYNKVNLKNKSSRELLSKIQDNYGFMTFNLRQLEKDHKMAEIRVRRSLEECIKSKVIAEFPVMKEKPDVYVAQFKYTVLVLNSGVLKVSGLDFDEKDLYQTEFSVTDEEVKKILATSISKKSKKRNNKKNKKKGEAVDATA